MDQSGKNETQKAVVRFWPLVAIITRFIWTIDGKGRLNSGFFANRGPLALTSVNLPSDLAASISLSCRRAVLPIVVPVDRGKTWANRLPDLKEV